MNRNTSRALIAALTYAATIDALGRCARSFLPSMASSHTSQEKRLIPRVGHRPA